MQDRFALLLKDFSVLAARGGTSVAPLTARIRTLLRQFAERRDRADTLEQAQSADDLEHIGALLAGYNEAVEHWGDARLLEESMERVRTKYKEVFQRIIDAITEAHPELDATAAYPTQFWGEGHIGFGRKSWPGGQSRWPSGLWLDNLRLEKLAAEDSEPPHAYIWVSNKSKSNVDFDAARVAVNAAAKELLSPEELKGTKTADSSAVLLSLPAPPKRELLSALSNGDGLGFVAQVVSQFDLMARFVPVLNKVFLECLAK